ncbi:MAG: hypothetical protein RLZZ628_2730 [Bacteroidota bacterium]
MKFFTNALWVFLALFVCTKPAMAQGQIEFEVSDSARRAERLYFNESQGYYTLGLHGGYSYQSSDVSNLYKGWGLALTLEKNFIHNRGNYLDLGIRARAMYANSFGLNTRPFTGLMDLNYAVNGKYNPNANYTSDALYYANYRNDFGELGLEGVITFNQLRETKGILLSLYGGFGLDVYYVGTDQTDANDTKYKYLTINPNQSVATIRQQLLTMRDGTYETSGDGFDGTLKAGIMPNVGIELGYQLTPKFSVGIGHRVMFTQTNLFDGQQWDNDNTISPRNDLHHFTSLDFKWIISGSESQQKPPKITIYRPDQNPYTTYNATETVQARITGIETGADVTFKVNGVSKPFDYFSKEFIATVGVDAPLNECIITARNRSGSTTAKVMLIKSVKIGKPIESGNPTNPTNPTVPTTPTPKPDPIAPTVLMPTVQITAPSGVSVTETSVVDFRATTHHIDRKDQVSLTLNNYPITDFTFYNNNISSRLNLREGSNQAVITVRNLAGQATDRYSITLNRPQEKKVILPPAVSVYTAPLAKGNESGCEQDWSASVQNVSNRNDIHVYLNGNAIDNWSFSNNRLNGRVRLQAGTNRIQVEARNESGSAAGDASANCDIEKPRPLPPGVSVKMEPFVKGNPLGCENNWTATVRNVSNRNDIKVYLNGSPIDNWTFANNQITGRARLRSGENRINIEVKNEVGSATGESVANCDTERPRLPFPGVRISVEGNIQGNNNGCQTGFSAAVQHVVNKNDIAVYFNGNNLYDWQFDEGTGMIRGNLNLRIGNNLLRVIARNESGEARDETDIYCNAKKLPPAIRFTRPYEGTRTTQSEVAVEATVLNVQRGAITLKLNNVHVNSFDFDENNKVLRANVPLTVGVNTLRLSAQNQDGSDEAQLAVIRIEEIREKRPARVTITAPQNNAVMTTPEATVKAALLNITTESQVTMYVNDAKFDAFKIDKLLKSLTARVPLREGNNLVTVRVENEDGNNQSSVNVVYNFPKPPVVHITSPADGTAYDAQNFVTVKANLENVHGKEGVRAYLNGNSIPFTVFNNVLTVGCNLQAGENAVRIAVSNAGGNAEDRIKLLWNRPAAPTATILNPALKNSTIETQTLKFEGQTTNVEKSNVTVTLNGNPLPTFNFDNGRVTATLNLNEGKNVIVLAATGKGGFAAAEATVNVVAQTGGEVLPERTRPLPIIRVTVADLVLTRPVIDVLDPKPISSTLTTTIMGAQQSDITLIVNDKNITDFKYDAKTHLLSYTFPVQGGQTYTVTVRVANRAGKAEKTETVRF